MLEEIIYKDYITALKSKEKAKVEFLSFIRAELKNRAIFLKKEKLEDSQVIEILKKQKKKLSELKDSLANKGPRQDILEKLNYEMSLLEGYLPSPLSKEEVVEIVEAVIKELGASSLRDMGKVMGAVLKKAGGRAEPKDIAPIVKEKLTNLS
ncbi:MAG TPA: GatB/YqeY domain-containing protein [Candidatus Omnitrophica bacterium]|nr:GatB/YqeY domain-containing protein [Candidatus Omnitrophota bacterium]